MTRYCLSMALLRVVLPSGLLIAIALRPFGLSIIYAILLLISPFPGLPNKRTVNKGFISKFSLLCLLVSTVFLMLQIAWYAVYARGIVPSELVLDIAHNMGFVSVEDELLITQACIPEMVMVLVSLAVTVVVYKLKSPIRHSTKPPGTHEKNKFQKFPVLVSAGRYICLFLLMFSGIMKPGVVSGVYFLVFLCAATAWSFGCSLRKGFAVVGACVAGVMAAHVLLLLVYQWTFVMELYPPGNPVARYMGFSKLVHLENTTSVEFSYVRLSNQHWATAFSPIVILLTYYVLAIECRELFKPKVGFIGTRAHGQSTETDPLLSHGLTGTGTRLQKDSKGSITVRDDESKTSLKDRKFMGELGNAVLNFFKVIIRSSYIATTVIMMAWSIMFHSWLAFVFLMWANVVWLCQDQRRFMLRTSPLLVFYAIFLLLADYVYSMDLLETELPSDIPKINLRQIGLGRMGAAARTALMIKSLFTCMFWVTLRQRVTQLRPARDDVSLQFVSVAPSASQTGASGTLTTRAGAWLRAACARCWIYVVVIMMFVIGVTGDRMTIFRIIYMFLFLAFILMFQISWYWWRRLLYIFWITLIMYSMINLILIYIYQFDNFSTIIEEFFYMNVKLQNDLGLARYHPADLFVKLLTPTLFLIMTIMQVHYFHKDFMKMSDPDRPGKDEESSKPSQMTSTAKDKTSAQGPSAAAAAAAAASKNSDSDEDISSLCNEDKSTFKRTHSFAPTDARSLAWRDVLASLCRRAHSLLRRASKKILLFLHMHLIKIIYLSLMLLCVLDVKALHVPIMMIISVLSVASAPQQRLSIIMISILISIYFMANMVYQIDYIQHSYFDVNCTADNPNATSSQNNADWVGFHKTQRRVSFASLMRGYIGVIALITFHSLISYSRTRHTSHVMFPGITRSLADKDVVHCLKFLFNYGFYKFGVEITLISLITTIVSRMDLYAVVYAAWLAALVSLRRAALARVWPAFTGFLVLAVPVQYIIALGAVPEFCVTYPWEGSDDQMVRLRNWLFLPYAPAPPHATKLIFDFLSLTLAARQLRVFRVERARGAAYEGGSNAEDVGADWETMDFSNPVPDFLAQIASWLDVIKRMVFLGMLWVTLAVMFLTGTNRVNPFSIGYLVGSFIFLWQGTDFYLRPKSTILLWWSWLLRYNCIVVIVKTLLQIPACIFESYMQTHACWVVQVLGIGCVDKFAGGTIRHFLKMDYLRTVQTCPVPQDSVGLVWDGLCFAFLILQRRLFHSYYFFRVIDESKATTILASRGAELIEELRQKQMGAQEDQESKILEKIKIKMERIKANQQRIHGISKEPKHHDIEEESESGSASARVPLVRGDSDASAREFHSPAATPSPPASPPPSPPASAPRGFHTPRSPASPRYRSPAASPPPAPAPPSPSSALMTVSLEAYLEPRRISFESPPSSLPRAPSPESYPVFSPPPRRRHTLASPAPPRMSLVSQCSREPHSHHTYGAEGPAGPDGPVRRECTNRHRGRPLKPPSSHQQAVRSGDYYMFDEFDDTEVQLKDDASEDDDDGPTEMGFGQEERRSGDLQKTEPLSEHMDEYLSQIDPEKQTVPERIAHLWDTASEFTSSILISLTRSVMKFSRDYRYVSRTLSAEKMSLKSKPDFGIGVREGSQMIWEPPRDCSSVQHRRQLMESTEGLDSNLLNPAAETGRKLSSLSVPEIRILAASVERGLDASPTPSRHSRHSRAASRRSRESDGTSEHESMFSLQTSESMDTLKEHDESAFRQGKSPLVYLGYAVWYAVLAHTDIVCYLMVFINQIQSATILSIPLPLMVFLWGTLTIPRPTKTFWVTLIAYTEVIVLIKSMFQFEILPWNQKVTPVNMPFTAPRIIGIERKANYALYDLLLLLIIFWHRFMLKSLGLWKESVPESDVYPDARYPVTEDDARLLAEGKTGVVGKKYMILHKTDTPRNMMPLSTAALEEQAGPSRTTDEHFTVDDDKQPIIAVKTQVEDTCDHYPGVLVLSLRRYLQPARAFFTYMLQPGARVTADVYAYMFLCDFFNFLVVIFGFAAFGTHQGDGGVKAYIEENKVPIPFLVMLILQFALIVIDRALYLRKFMLGKILFQYALIVGVHIWMFFVLPFITERTFNTMLPPPMWYVVKCVYLLLSAYQIRCGYPRRIIGNFLCKSYQFINIMLFRAFVAVPFVFELRTLMDWIWTDTSMTLMDWLKMEDIFASVFLLKCSRNMEDKFPQARGSRKSPVSKYLLGGSVLAFVIAIIWFPLVFFAFGNTVGEPNPPTDVTVKIRIGPFLPIYQMSAQSNNINKFTEQDYNQLSNLYARDRTAQTFLSNYLYDDVAVVTISPNSTLAWGISPPELDRLELEAASNASITIKFAFVITHPSNNNQNPPSIEESRSVELPASLAGAPSPERDKLAAMLAGNASDADWLNVKMLFPKFLKVFNKGTAKPAYQLTPAGTQGDTAEDVAASRLYRDVQLRLERDRGAMYWRVREACHAQDFLLSVPHNDCSRLVMYTFNDKLFPETLNLISGGGIIGLYTTFVFLASRVLRSFFSGIYTKIMFDDLPYVDRVLQLCLDIYLVREAVELKLEEDLFAKLVFLYRSPETMIKWTRPKEEVEEQRALPAPPN